MKDKKKSKNPQGDFEFLFAVSNGFD